MARASKSGADLIEKMRDALTDLFGAEVATTGSQSSAAAALRRSEVAAEPPAAKRRPRPQTIGAKASRAEPASPTPALSAPKTSTRSR